MERNSTGMMVAGIVILSVGGVGFVVGGALVAEANDDCFDGSCKDEEMEVAGIITMIAGGSLVALGLPLTIVGARKVRVDGAPTDSDADDDDDDDDEEDAGRWVPEVSLGPASGSVRLRF